MLLPGDVDSNSSFQVLRPDAVRLSQGLQLVLVALLQPTCQTLDMVQLVIQHSAGQLVLGHVDHMSKPAQLVQGDLGLDTSAVGLCKNFSVRHMITAGEPQNGCVVDIPYGSATVT